MGDRIKKLNGDGRKTEGKRSGQWKAAWTAAFTLFLVLMAGVFAWRWPAWQLGYPIDAGRWGAFGDFIGGLLGSVFTLISVYYLHSTYMEQRAANKEMSEDYDRHIKWERERRFEDNFNTLLSLYKEATRAYSFDSAEPGKPAMDLCVKEALRHSFNSKEAYMKRVMTASSSFFSLLRCPQHVINTHMRLLYQLLYQLGNSPIDENERRIYAKSLRSQLTDMELILIRYNCWRKAGKNMRSLIAQYNMLKHLPPLSLLEYGKYTSDMGGERCLNALNDELVAWRKEIRNLFEAASLERVEKEKSLGYGKIFGIKLGVNEDCKRYIFELTQTNKSTQGVRNLAAKALMGMTDEDMKGLLEDFHREVFEMGNFKIWNNVVRPCYSSSFEKPEPDGGYYRLLRIEVTCKEPIIVTFNQIRFPVNEL